MIPTAENICGPLCGYDVTALRAKSIWALGDAALHVSLLSLQADCGVCDSLESFIQSAVGHPSCGPRARVDGHTRAPAHPQSVHVHHALTASLPRPSRAQNGRSASWCVRASTASTCPWRNVGSSRGTGMARACSTFSWTVRATWSPARRR